MPAAKAPAGGSHQPTYEQLLDENKRLRDLVTARAADTPSWCGYLYKYRPYASHGLGHLLAQPWELRFVVVSGTVLQYYKTEKDTIFHPRGHIDLKGTIVEVEGLKNRRFWTFGVVDRSGLSLIRLSSESQAEANKWVAALEKAGCAKRQLTNDARARSPLRSADVRWDNRASSPGPATTGRNQTASGPPPGNAGSSAELRNRYSPIPAVRVPSAPYPMSPEAASGYASDSQASEPTDMPPERPHRGKERSVMIGSTPVHTDPRASLLSSERVKFQRHLGLINLGMVILIAANSRLIIENLLKYGIRFNPANYVRSALQPSGNHALLLCWPALVGFVLVSYAIELLALSMLKRDLKVAEGMVKKGAFPSEVRRHLQRTGQSLAVHPETWVALLHVINTMAELVVPCYVVQWTCADALPSFVLVLTTVAWWMKLVSYAHTNWDLRMARRFQQVRPGERGGGDHLGGCDEPLQYPENVSISNLAYFMAAPTLCYQVSYPRNSRFRSRWLLRRLLELCIYLGLLLFITEQYIVPTIMNSLGPLKTMHWGHCAERLLKLALPCLYWWLCMFYLLFHVWLNIWAEITRFADREFYKDWWNATTIGEYWRTWNQPVHKWMLRHVYFPLNRYGVSKSAAGILVFFISAVFHELLVGVPLHMLRAWAFLGIMGQVPMMIVTDMLRRKVNNDQVGNIIFWISFCIIGQPLSLMLYYHDWIIANRPQWLAAEPANGS